MKYFAASFLGMLAALFAFSAVYGNMLMVILVAGGLFYFVRQYPVFLSILLTFVLSSFALTQMEEVRRGQQDFLPHLWEKRMDIQNIKPNGYITGDDGLFLQDIALNESEWYTQKGGKINSDGFRSREFDTTLCEAKPRILFLGDSFTEGHATHFDSTFVDRIEAAGYCTFNTGVAGADVPQYLVCAKKCIRRTMPEYVCLMFCDPNDITLFPREVSKEKPLGYNIPELGGLMQAQHPHCPVVPFSIEESVQYYYLNHAFRTDNVFLRYCARTKVLEQIVADIYFLVSKARCPVKPDTGVVTAYIKEIKEETEMHGAKLLVFILPDRFYLESNQTKYREKHRNIFEGIEIFIPSMDVSDYPDTTNNMHFNDKGNRVMAEFILKTLRETNGL